ncbi:MAG: TonB-dependent receptor [Chitinophagaceae bacterium]|nr:TonB-dependent receptor [Chitinophagaceae bacterium]
MKKMLFGICYLLLTRTVVAQNLPGKVTDAATGAAIASATIELDNAGFLISSDSGEFEFKKLKPRTYAIRISAIGFRTYEGGIQPTGQKTAFKLERINLFMQPVEVRATRAGEKAPFTKTNISKKEIEKLNLGQDLPFILNQTPSVIVHSDAGNGIGYTGLRIRGSDATRINMTINGIPYNDAESQGLFFVNLPDLASSINNIQIQRGVGTSSNGAGAFGATINFSTNEVNTNPYCEINNGYGSFNTWKHTVKLGSGLINDHFTIDARLSKISSDGYIDRASTDLESFSLSGAYLNKKTSVRVNILSGKEKTYQAWYGVLETDLRDNRTVNYAGTEKQDEPYKDETDNYRQDHYQLFVNHQLNNKITLNTALFLTQGKGYYEQYKTGENYADYGLPDFIQGNDTMFKTDLIRRLWLQNNFYGQVISFHYKTIPHQLTIGGGWTRYDGNHFGHVIWAEAGVADDHRWYDLDAYKTDINVYAKYQRKLFEKLEAFADVQYRKVLYAIGGFRDNPALKSRNNYHFVNPKIGVTYSDKDYQLYASYSIANKEPNRDDFEAGQQQPKPERLHDIELGIEKKNALNSWGATLYYMKYNNQLVLTGKVNDVGAYARTNIAASYRFGIELQGSSKISDWLSISANATWSRNRIDNFTEYYDDYDNGGQKSIPYTSTDISFSPSLVSGMALHLIPIKNAEISLSGKYVSRQYLDNTSNTNRSLDPYYVQDIRLTYTLKRFLFKESNLVLLVNNIFNKKYEPNGYSFSYLAGGAVTTENYYYPMAGTNLMMALNIKL